MAEDPRKEKQLLQPDSVFRELDESVRSIPGMDAGDRSTLDDLKRSFSIIETLLHVSTSINSTLNLDDLLEKIVDAVVRITDTNRGYLMLREDSGQLTLVLARSRDGESISKKGFDRSLSVVRNAARTGEPQVVMNAQEDPTLKDKRSVVDLDIRTVICIPLKFQDNLVGVIYADSDHVSGAFSPSDISIMNAFGAQAAVAIENARQHGALESLKDSLETQNIGLRQELAGKYEFSGIIGRSQGMREIFEVISKVAPLATTVLIQGDTGTGKELIAKAIHYNSARKHKPMLSINCGALPANLLESELFGYRRGAFTGADQDRAGLFEAADGGTLFLDEIGEMSPELQVKLLRVLQDGEVRRLGENHMRTVSVRIIAATNRELREDVERGAFRNDLFYRLNVVPIYLPPLRDRQEDILPLAEFFLAKYSEKMNIDKPVLTRGAREMLLLCEWCGNVRELENAVERTLALSEGKRVIDAKSFEHLMAESQLNGSAQGDTPLRPMLLHLEKELIRKTLIQNSWNVSKAAANLHMSRQQLHVKIRKFGLVPEI